MAIKKTITGRYEVIFSYRKISDPTKYGKKRGTFDTMREARIFEAELSARVANGEDLEKDAIEEKTKSEITYGEMLEQYLNWNSETASPRIINDKRNMALRFWPKWFDKPYGSIKPKDYLDKWLVIKNANYSTERANKYIILLRAVSKFGSNFYEYKDEARSIRPFKKKHGEGRKAVALSIEQLHLLIDHTPDPVYKILFWFLYFTGLRIGEARALQKEDVQGSIIDVNKSIRSFKEGFKPPKNQSSYRMNRIDSTTYEVIQPLLQGDPGFLFGGEEPLSMRQVDKARKEALESAGLPYFVNHDLDTLLEVIFYQRALT